MTKLEAAMHSERKFSGTTDENLKKHELTIGSYGNLKDKNGAIFHFTGKNCALCRLYDQEYNNCYGCPLAKVTRKTCYHPGSQWHKVERGDFAPMRAALKKAVLFSKLEE
jgi:hypothetical protein